MGNLQLRCLHWFKVASGGKGTGGAGQGLAGGRSGSRRARPGGAAGRVTSPGWGAALGGDGVLSRHRGAQPLGKGLGPLTPTRSPPGLPPLGWKSPIPAHSQDPGASLRAVDTSPSRTGLRPRTRGFPAPTYRGCPCSCCQPAETGVCEKHLSPREWDELPWDPSPSRCSPTPPGAPQPLGCLPVLPPYGSLPALGGVTYSPPPYQCHGGGYRDTHGTMGTCAGDTGVHPGGVGTERGDLGSCTRAVGMHSGAIEIHTEARETPGLWGHGWGRRGCAPGGCGNVHTLVPTGDRGSGSGWEASASTVGPSAGAEEKGAKSPGATCVPTPKCRNRS